MTTEDKIKEAFEAWHKNNFDDLDGPIKLVIEQTFLAGYMACLNGLEYAATLSDNGNDRVAYFL